MRLISSIVACFAVSAAAAASLPGQKLSPSAQSLFDFSMSINDPRWDATYKNIWFLDNGQWSNRFTSWYIPGLLYRNKGSDRQNAIDALGQLLTSQMNYAFDSEWYGGWKLSPDEPNPTPDSDLYPPKIYGSYDPNWNEFIGMQLVQIIEEFEHVLPASLVKQMEAALAYAAVGSMRRNGTDPDNLILAYSNPQLMRTLVVGWIGARANNQTFIDFANTKGQQLYDLFSKNGANTLGEYNSPNYYGIDVFALAANIKYGPPNATFTKLAKPMLAELWKDVAAHYNPYLGNLVGPYDRAYTRDMPSHNSIIMFYWWGIFGLENAPRPPMGDLDLHYDVSQGAAIALVLDQVAAVLDSKTAAALTARSSADRTLKKNVYVDLETDKHRVATSWISDKLMAGGMEQNETVNRGKQFTPAIVHWAADRAHQPYPYNGFFSLYPTMSTLKAVASPNKLAISYPNVTQEGTDSFQFMLSGIPPPWNLKQGNVVDGFRHLPCLQVQVDAPGLEELPTVYGSTIYSHYYYNITYIVPANFSGVPSITFDLKYAC